MSKTVKVSLTALDEVADKLSTLADDLKDATGLEYELWVNAMVESPLEKVEQSIDKIMQETLSKPGVEISLVAGFTRVPGYPKPTKRIGN